MESNSNMLAMSNADENGKVPQSPINHVYWGQPQNQPTSYETKTASTSVQQQHSRKPFQTLNSNTSATGAFHHDILRSASSNTTKPLKVRNYIRVCSWLIFCVSVHLARWKIDIFVRTDFGGVVNDGVCHAVRVVELSLTFVVNCPLPRLTIHQIQKNKNCDDTITKS